MDKYIIVNATAPESSGTLTILKQFVANIPHDKYHWLVFVSDKISLQTPQPNVRIVPMAGVKPMLKRLWWDCIGLNRWLKKHHIEPMATVSLQNTGFRVSQKNIPDFIYYHQPLPFFPYSWNPLKKNERILWFYKHIYPLCVRLFLSKDTTVFVQLDFIKEGFVKYFRHPQQNVKVYSPSVAEPENSDLHIDLDTQKVNLFYPAIGVFYKNHRVLRDALQHDCGQVQMYFTLENASISWNADRRISLLGVLPYAEVCAMYRHCDALVFPSYIETFGLPLIEAAMTGMPVLAADLPYAREVLDGYEGVTFIPHNDPKAWADAIAGLEKGKRHKPLDISDRPGWKELFNDIIE